MHEIFDELESQSENRPTRPDPRPAAGGVGAPARNVAAVL